MKISWTLDAAMDGLPANLRSVGITARIWAWTLACLYSEMRNLTLETFLPNGGWSVVTSFATLHHIPSRGIRLNILRTVHQLLKPDGLFIHSNWQFLNSERLKARIQPWDAVSISRSEVDAGDYLLDWRSGGEGLRYVHHYDENELQGLAEEAGFKIKNVFYSDGETRNLGLYEVWEK